MHLTGILGFLNVDKPGGITSHDVVAKCRRVLGIKKIGHAGTLDPMATGVLVLCLGGATRLSEYVMHSTKRYCARVRLGITTDTYDADGKIQSEKDAAHISQKDVERVLHNFLGDIKQIPPMYSAIKQNGRKLYELARAGETVERPARDVRIDALTVSNWGSSEFTLDVTCSAGTYIRSLAHDMGQMLGVGAHLSGLIRVASGSLTLETAVAFDDLLSAANWQDYLIAPRVALPEWGSIYLNPDEAVNLAYGRAIVREDLPDDLAFAYAPNGDLIALVQAADGLLHPHKVFS